MIDFAHLPKPQNGTIDYFPGFSNTTGGSWEVWNKPRGINFIKIITIGGGGGGAVGATNPGGGGGGSGGVTTVMMPAIFLPDRLYVSSGLGGLGGIAANVSGGDGSGSHVSIAPSTAAIYTVCYANRGAAGQYNSAGGAAGAVATIANTLQSGMGNFIALVGQVGLRGSDPDPAPPNNIIYPTTGLLLSGGAGGAGFGNVVGGSVNAPSSQTSTYTVFPTQPGGSPGGGRGVDGINNMELLLFSGGSGGGATTTGIGGRGGNGGIGSGGGGGGVGSIFSNFGNGGNGGPGLVIISSW